MQKKVSWCVLRFGAETKNYTSFLNLIIRREVESIKNPSFNILQKLQFSLKKESLRTAKKQPFSEQKTTSCLFRGKKSFTDSVVSASC